MSVWFFMIAYYTSVSVEPMMKAHTKTYSVTGIDELKLYDKVYYTKLM